MQICHTEKCSYLSSSCRGEQQTQGCSASVDVSRGPNGSLSPELQPFSGRVASKLEHQVEVMSG